MQQEFFAVARAGVLLSVGFALTDTGPGQALGDLVATALATLATPLLQMVDPDILRTGTELRGAEGWAIRVSEVCDGHGLAISLAAGLAALAPGLRATLWRLVVGLVAIQLFNLFRIVSLALVLSSSPGAFDFIHAAVFPLLTVALLAVCVLPLPRALPLLALALPLVLLWLPLADTVAKVLVPPANLILSLVAGVEIGQIAERAAGWSVGTNLLASGEAGQVRLFLAPLRPADFALALPIIVAAVAWTRQPWWLVPTMLSMLAALTLAAFTAVWGLAAAQPSATVLLPDGTGAFIAQDFSPPEMLRALIRLAQNVLVHLNLLVLPFLILAAGRRHA